MTVWQWLATLRLRWPVVVIGLLCTAVAVLLVHKRPIAYQACASVAVVAPKTTVAPNVYYDQLTSLVVATGLITDQVSSNQVQQRLSSEGLSASYQAQVLNTGSVEIPAYSVPEMNVCSSSYSSEMSLRTTDAVLQEFGTILRARQVAAHVQPGLFVTDTVIAAPASLPVTGRPSQAYLGVGAIGLLVTGASAVWADRWLRRRARSAGGWSAWVARIVGRAPRHLGKPDKN
jgi:hypothetical protein